jgi:predicted dehydrogenase
MKKLKYAVFGCGFWSHFQISGWNELEGLELVALYNRTLSKAEQVAEKFNVPAVYDDPKKLFRKEELDFVDIITDVDTHLKFTKMAARQGLDVVCQKPMASSWGRAKELVEVCKKNKVKLYINENFRWQAPIRKVKEVMNAGIIGDIFKARISFCSAFPVFDNQPFLAELDQFILTDIGSHVFAGIYWEM